MNIFFLSLGAIGSAFYYYFVSQRTGNAAIEIFDPADRMFRGDRGQIFRDNGGNSRFSTARDPGTTAAILLVNMLAAGHKLAPADRNMILDFLADFAAVPNAEDALAFAEWADQQNSDPVETIRHCATVWNTHLSSREKIELHASIAKISRSRQDRSRAADHILDRLARALSI